MRTAAGLAAQVVVVLHLAYLLYVLLGGFLGLRGLGWLWPHVITAVWGTVGVLTAAPCPLTVLEKYLRAEAGQETYVGPFIDHYLAGTLYPAAWQDWVWMLCALTVLTSYAVSVGRHVSRQAPPVPR
jgi:hypothetical protein